jgi:exodeoxyribonuclease VIII
MKNEVMLDLETLGRQPGAVIVAIGAVKFIDDRIVSECYLRIDPRSAVAEGLSIDADTVCWWLTRSETARLELVKSGGSLREALFAFGSWLDDPNAEVWGNGAGFDNVLLAEAYDRCGIARPWQWWNDRCYRTMKALRPDIAMSRSGTHHHALDDARSQARHLMAIRRALAWPGPAQGTPADYAAKPLPNEFFP